MKKILMVFIFPLLITACVKQQPMNWQQAMSVKINRYSAESKNQLAPYFSRANLPYPPKQLGFLIFKDSKRLDLYAKNNQSWKFVRSFPLFAASGHAGPKLKAGDYQVPEGIYHIVELNPRSHYDLSMHLNYPNTDDKRFAQMDHRNNLGGDIYIHGDKSSAGCIALGNATIQALFPLVYYVGERNIEVIIAPTDLRVEKPRLAAAEPKWTPVLYAEIRHALSAFPEA